MRLGLIKMEIGFLQLLQGIKLEIYSVSVKLIKDRPLRLRLGPSAYQFWKLLGYHLRTLRSFGKFNYSCHKWLESICFKPNHYLLG